MNDTESPDPLQEIPEGFKLDMILETLGVLEQKLDALSELLADFAKMGEMAQQMMSGGGLGALLGGMR